MFDFSILISLLVSVIIFYFTLFFSLKRELDDLSNTIKKSDEIESKISIRRKSIKLLNILAIIFIIVILLLYNLPSIIISFSNIEPISFSEIGQFLLKLVPFKEGFFSDSNFKFSYITEIILSIIVTLLTIFVFYILLDETKINIFIKFMIVVLLLIALMLGFLWLNNYISLFLTYCIIHYFAFLSIVLNIISYVIISLIIFLLLCLFNEFLPPISLTGDEKQDS